MRVVKHWNRLPKEMVDAPSLVTFKVRFGMALSSLVYWKMSLLSAGWLEYVTFKSAFQPKPIV